jgi:peptidylprolyl isomerase
VRVHYNGWTSGGKLVDSSFKKGRASIFILDDLIAGLSEGIQLMSAGDTMRFWIPPALAQGEAAAGGPLVYQVELLAVIRAPDPPPPAELAAPPKDAVKSTSGLAWKVLRFGEGFARPGTESIVALRFSGWTAADGKWRDTNFARPIPSVFPVKDLVAGWAEGIVLMTPGEKRRFWIPGELAYKGQAGKPQGMVVYDLELVEIRQQQAPAR